MPFHPNEKRSLTIYRLDAESRKLRALESRGGPELSGFERSEDATKGPQGAIYYVYTTCPLPGWCYLTLCFGLCCFVFCFVFFPLFCLVGVMFFFLFPFNHFHGQ